MEVCGVSFTPVDPNDAGSYPELSIYNNAPQQYMIIPINLIIEGKHEKALETNYIGTYDFQTVMLRSEANNSPKKRVFFKEYTRPTEVQTINNLLSLQPYGCVVPTYGVCMINTKVCLISQLVEYNLNTFLKSHTEMTLIEKLRLCKQMTKKLLIIHDNGLIHGNVCPTNVLITEGGTAFYTDVRNGPPDLENLAMCSDDTLRFMYVTLQSKDCIPSAVTDRYSLCLLVIKTLTGSLPFSDTPAIAFPNMVSKLTPDEISTNILEKPQIPELMRDVMKRMLMCDEHTSIEELKAAIDETLLLELGRVAGTHAGITLKEAEARIINNEKMIEECNKVISREIERVNDNCSEQIATINQIKTDLNNSIEAQNNKNDEFEKLIQTKDEENKDLTAGLKKDIEHISSFIEEMKEENGTALKDLKEAVDQLNVKIDTRTEALEEELKRLREELESNKAEQQKMLNLFESRIEEVSKSVESLNERYESDLSALKEEEDSKHQEHNKKIEEITMIFNNKISKIEDEMKSTKGRMEKTEQAQDEFKNQQELDQAVLTEIKFQNFSMIDTISYLKSKIEKCQMSSL